VTVRAILAGVVIGAAYTASPLFVVFVLCLVPLFRWAAADLGHGERRWLFAILGTALAVRIAAIAILLLTSDPMSHSFNVFVPDARFTISRSWWALNQWRGSDIGPVYWSAINNPYGATSYTYILAFIQYLVGASPYGVNFVSVLSFFVAAIAIYRLVRTSYSSSIALLGLAVLVFWPTLIVWSVSALRESIQLALTALALVVVVRAVRSGSWAGRLAAAIVTVATLAAIRTLRSGAIVIVASGVAGGLAARVLTIRPLVARVGAVVLMAAAIAAASRPGVQQRFLSVAREAVLRHVGNVGTSGNGYKVIDARFYGPQITDAIDTLTIPEAVDFVIRAAAAFFVVPLPWQLASTSELVFLPEQVAWYGLLFFGLIGLAAAYRRDPLLTWLLVAHIATVVVVIAPNSGNIGTLVRHRDVVLLALVWLSATGVFTVAARYSQSVRLAPSPHGELRTCPRIKVPL
jgi:hypothetical protein